jgi:type VI secretion system secreted protein Hcp
MASEILLEITGIKGESNAEGKADWIDISSWSWGISNPVTIATTKGASGGKASVSGINLMKATDVSSAGIQKALLQGTHIPDVKLHLLKQTGSANPEVYLELDMKDCYIESFQVSGSDGSNGAIMESVSIAFKSYSYTYSTQGSDGTLAKGQPVKYDLTTHKTS